MARFGRQEPVVADDARQYEASVERPLATGIIGQVLVLGAGAVLVLVGALALIRAGVAGDMSTPIVSVLGYTHTAWLGIGELAAGVLLLLAGMSPTAKGFGAAVGILLIISGVLVRADLADMPRELAMEHGYGWFLIGVGIVATIGGLLPGGRTRRWQRNTRTVA